jgi:hypothetical protein
MSVQNLEDVDREGKGIRLLEHARSHVLQATVQCHFDLWKKTYDRHEIPA